MFSVLAFTTCRKENALDCFKPSGKETTRLRLPGSFNELHISDKIEVTVKKGPDCQVRVTAGENIIGNVLTEVRGGVLYIRNNNKCNVVRGYKRQISVEVTLPHLKYLKSVGVAPTYFDPRFTQDTLLVRAEGSGDIHVRGSFNQVRTSSYGNGDTYLEGSCNSLFVYTNGTNFIFAQQMLISDYAFIHLLTLGDCLLSGKDLKKLEYNIERSGNIYCDHKPATISNFSPDGADGRLIIR